MSWFGADVFVTALISSDFHFGVMCAALLSVGSFIDLLDNEHLPQYFLFLLCCCCSITCFIIGVEYVSVRDPMPHSLCNNVTLTLTSTRQSCIDFSMTLTLTSKVVLILANCPTAAGYSAYGGRCLKVYLDNVNYTTAQGRCSADGCHLYHYKSLAFDREPVRLLLESSGGYSCHQRFSLLLIIAQFQSLISSSTAFFPEEQSCCLKFTMTATAPGTMLCVSWLLKARS